jgi:hypothetical protein
MKIWVRVIVAGVLALALSGCILQSKLPLFGDAQAKMLLASYGNPVTYERTAGEWVKAKDQIVFAKQAGHYLATLDKTELAIRFVPLDDKWWILQAVEANKPAAYLLVEAKPEELLFYPIACKALKDSGKYKKTITFVDSDCFIKFGTDYKVLFSGFTANPGEATTKLVPATYGHGSCCTPPRSVSK